MENIYWSLKTELFRLERQETALKAEVSQAKYDLRTAKVNHTEYSGSFRAFLDKLSGKQEQKLLLLRHAEKQASIRLAGLEQDITALQQSLSQIRTRLESCEPLPDSRGEARYCIACLMTLLPEAEKALSDMGDWMRGAIPGQIISKADRQQFYGECEQKSARCGELLNQLEAALNPLDIPFDLPNCCRDPIAYLANATEYTRRDRLNDLIRHSIKLRKQLPDLQRQL